MKKIIYSILFVSALFITSCSDDDDNGGDCFTCDDGTACDNGDGTFTVTYEEDGETVSEKITYEFAEVENFAELKADGCGDDDDDDDDILVDVSEECVTCAEFTFQEITNPSSEVCKLENGNASVLGIDTGLEFSQYISSQELFTTCN